MKRFVQARVNGGSNYDSLKLPKDTAIPFFHSEPGDGGLGILNIQRRIPIMQRERLGRIITECGDPVVRAIVEEEWDPEGFRRILSVKEYGGTPVETKHELHSLTADELYKTVDGRGLKLANQVAKAQKWVTNGEARCNGHVFVGAVGVRANTLPTKLRMSRGYPEYDRTCDVAACGNLVQSLDHILQKCPRTHGARVQRHNKVESFIANKAKKRGWKVVSEPRILTTKGYRIPDLVLEKGGNVVVTDVSIVTDSWDDLSTPHKEKVVKYDLPEIKEFCQNKYGNGSPLFSAAIISWRGVWAKESATDLVGFGILGPRDLRTLSLMVCEAGARIHRINYCSGWRGKPQRRVGVG